MRLKHSLSDEDSPATEDPVLRIHPGLSAETQLHFLVGETMIHDYNKLVQYKCKTKQESSRDSGYTKKAHRGKLSCMEIRYDFRTRRAFDGAREGG
jgi:hypothetical protein